MKKYILVSFAVLILGLLIIPNLSFAQIPDPDPNPTGSDCVALQSSNLRYRSRDANTNGEVSTLQDFLQSKGYLNSEPTGYFGLLTVKAVKDFQSANGISPTGYIGSATRAKASSLTGCNGTIITTPISSIITTPTTFPPGCNSAVGFSNTTGLPCDGSQTKTFPPGCTSTKGYSNTTGEKCIISTSNDPVISGVSGPQTLNVNQQGTWTVNASSSNGGTLSYSVAWGDEVYSRERSSPATSSSSTQQSAMFTHTYSTAGTFTPTFTVTSANTIMCVTTPCPGNGGSAKTSLSVKVGNTIYPLGCDSLKGYSPITGLPCDGTIITTPSITVLSPNGGEVYQTGGTIKINWTSSNKTKISILLDIYDSPTDLGYNEYSIAKNIPDTGTYSWIIPGYILLYGEGGVYDMRLEGKKYRIMVINESFNEKVLDTSDNLFTITSSTIPTNLPDLIVTDFSWTPVNPVVNTIGQLSVTITIKNIGTSVVILPEHMLINEYKGDLKIGGIKLGTAVYKLAPGDSHTFNSNTAQGPNILETAGTFDFTVKVDDKDPYLSSNSAGLVRESNENNNSLTKKITVISSGNGCSNGEVYSSTTGQKCLALTCDTLKVEKSYYFDVCKSNHYDNACFNKFSGEYQGCSYNNDPGCTVNNTNAAQNILCAISSTPITPSITVLSPSGGGWKIGSTQTIKWSPADYYSDAIIDLFQVNGSSYSLIKRLFDLRAVVNSGTRDWTIDNTIQPGSNYVIGIKYYKGNYVYTSDYSYSNQFSFVSTPTISSVSGPQTLNVGQTGTWTVSASDSSSVAGGASNLTYSVNWGDAVTTCTSGGACVTATQSPQQTGTFTHTYSTAGTYNPTFTVTNTSGQSAKTSLSVTVENLVSTNHNPVLGPIAVPVSVNVGQSVDFSFSATDADNDNLSWVVDWGESPYGAGTCPVTNLQQKLNWTKSTSHVWNSSGTYNVKVSVNDCKGGSASTDFNVNVIGTTTPTISSVSGPQTLNVNQQGTWTVSASDSSSVAGGASNLTYSVNWGDAVTTCTSGGACVTATQSPQQTGTFTHTYNTAGTYNPTFTVTNSNGQSAETSLSVKVNLSIVYPSGCTSYQGYSYTTGLACDGSSSTSGGGDGSSGSATRGSTTTTTTTRSGIVSFVPETSLSANALSALDSATSNEKSSQTNSNTNVSSSCKFTMTLSKGMNNPEVKCLQKMLEEKGFKINGVNAGEETTYFGYATLTALKEFQTANQLSADGIFGPATRTALVK